MDDDKSSVCLDIPGMVPAVDVDPRNPTLQYGLAVGSDIAIDLGAAVAIRGLLGSAVVFCRSVCVYRHRGSIVTMPDTLLLELEANGNPQPKPTAGLKREDGRVCHLFKITNSSSPLRT
jgi:hypothetical protein